MKVYVASAWWRDCDPFTSVVALDERRCETLINEQIQEAADQAADDEAIGASEDGEPIKDADDLRGDIAWSGVHEEELEGLKLTDEQESDLILDGYIYLDVS